ncbi:contact-dependent growth inhibition system immunity protein [Paenibacillus sp. N3/727]|nr:contact-dependent growth inhibition system immunity protein [Paenibacillus sp. N3/727]UNK21355.1 contact-dependent growth inhibition system immunity protein [Paenibacillus sp. N3/727]
MEDCDWGEPEYCSSLVVNVHRLRKTPLKNFSDEDLRLMILQQVSLDYLLPIAFERLINNPLRSGEMYTGDLLSSILKVDKAYWTDRQDFKHELDDLLNEFNNTVEVIDEYIKKYRNK